MAQRFLSPFTSHGLFGTDPFFDLQREMIRLFDRNFRGLTEGNESGFMLSPRVDISQKEDGWEVTAELPGVDLQDIELRLEGDLLTISGEKRDVSKDEKNRVVERSYGSFTRSFQLPFTPDPDRVAADCDQGVLTIKLPRAAEQDRSRRISISGLSKPTSGRGPAIGKNWTKEKSENRDLDKKKAEQDLSGPA